MNLRPRHAPVLALILLASSALASHAASVPPNDPWSAVPTADDIARHLLTATSAQSPSLALDAPVDLAQRAIRRPAREPGAPEAPAGPSHPKSPGLAVGLAIVAPGSGQLYMGQSHGYAQLAVEALGWISFLSLHKSGIDRRNVSREYVGDVESLTPSDTTNTWTFERYCPGRQNCDDQEYADLQQQYQDERSRFYESILDAAYASGWSSPAARASYADMRDEANRFLRLSRYATAAIVVNHVVSLIDAVHGARGLKVAHVLPRNVDVRWAMSPVGPRGAHGTAALIYRF